MRKEYLGDGRWKFSKGKAGLIYTLCDDEDGCAWMLFPDYSLMRVVAQHGFNREHILLLDRFDDENPTAPQEAAEQIRAWLDRCHEYEAFGLALAQTGQGEV